MFIVFFKRGITDEVISAQDFSGEGLWIDEPNRAVAFGFLYFAATAIFEIYTPYWFLKKKRSRV